MVWEAIVMSNLGTVDHETATKNLEEAQGLIERGEFEAAQEQLKKLATARPHDYRLWVWLCIAERRLNRPKEALEAAKRAYELESSNIYATKELIKAYALNKMSEEADALKARARRTWGSDPEFGVETVSAAPIATSPSSEAKGRRSLFGKR